MPCQTPKDLDLYLEVGKKEMKFINAKYPIQVGYWARKNGLQDYKFYAIVICMFDENFLNNLRQAPRDNPWLAHLTNQNYKT